MNRFLKTAVSLVAALAVAPAAAIVNIEAVRHADLKPGVSGDVGMALNSISSSSDEMRTRINGRLDYIHASSHSFAVARGAYNEVNDTIRRRGMLHLRHVQTLADVVSPYEARFNMELFGQSARDDYSSLRKRSLLGAGLRVNRPFTDGFDHALGTALMSEWRQEIQADEKNNRNIGRGNFYLNLGAEIGDTVDTGFTGYFQPKLNEWGDFSAIGEFFVDKGLTEQLSLRFIAGVVHDSTPPPGDHSTREEYGFRLIYEFGR